MCKFPYKKAILLTLFLYFTSLGSVFAETGGVLTDELDGTSLTYHYTTGRKYDVKFTNGIISWLRKDVPGREWEEGVPYIARKIREDMYYINWSRDEITEYITILMDFENRVLYTSARLEGGDKHFDLADIVELSRP